MLGVLVRMRAGRARAARDRRTMQRGALPRLRS